MSNERELLFFEGDLDATLSGALAKAVSEVEKLDPNYLLQVSETDLIASLVEKHRVLPVTIKKEDIHVDGPREAKVDVSHDFRYGTFPGERTVVPGMTLTVIVPFEGDPTILRCKPPKWNLNPPGGEIKGQEIHLHYGGVDLQAEAMKKQYQDELLNIEKYLSWGCAQIDRHNSRVEEEIKKAVTARKQRLLKNQGVVADLGLPLKRRDMPRTYSVPMKPRKPKVEMPKASQAAFKPEPALSDEDYEFILHVIQDMSVVMERSPRAFASMGEEDIRTQILVQLNGHFQGEATGETFNYEGKTDILIRHEGRNIFIAECKFWRGERALLETIDQLLGYTSWRDTKTAIVLFNRTKNFSNVLRQIPEVVGKHPNFKKDLGKRGETQFRYLFHHRDDKNRELTVTVLAFDVPSPEG